MNKKTKKDGFTIIEVVLVLAIAGVIFLMVFIALPALQRGWRDTQRTNDLGRLVSQVTSYTNSHRGNLPTNWNSFVNSYLTVEGDSFIDPSGSTATQGSGVTTYVLQPSNVSPLTSNFSDSQNVIYYSIGYTCSANDGAAVTSSGSRKVAFRMVLEGGGITCRNN